MVDHTSDGRPSQPNGLLFLPNVESDVGRSTCEREQNVQSVSHLSVSLVSVTLSAFRWRVACLREILNIPRYHLFRHRETPLQRLYGGQSITCVARLDSLQS